MEPESNKSAETPPVSNPQTEAVEEEASNNLNEANGAENSEGNDGDFILRAEYFQNEETLEQLESFVIDNAKPTIKSIKTSFKDLRGIISQEVDSELKKFNERQDMVSFFQSNSNEHDIFLLKAHRLMDLFSSKRKSVYIENFNENDPRHTASLKETRGNTLDIYDVSEDALTLAFPGQMTVTVKNDEKQAEYKVETDPSCSNGVSIFAHFPVDVFKFVLTPFLSCHELFLMRGVCKAWKQTISDIWFRNFKQEFKHTEQADFFSKEISSQIPHLKVIDPFLKYLQAFSGQIIDMINWNEFQRSVETESASPATTRLLCVLLRLIHFDHEDLGVLASFSNIVNIPTHIQSSLILRFLPGTKERINSMRQSLFTEGVDIPSMNFLIDFRSNILSTPDLLLGNLAKEDNGEELQKTKMLVHYLQFLFILINMVLYITTFISICRERKDEAIAKSIHTKSPDNLLKLMLFRSVKFQDGKIMLDNSAYTENLLEKALEETVGFQTTIMNTIKSIIELLSQENNGDFRLEDIEKIMPKEEWDEEGNLKPDKETVDASGTVIRVFVDVEFKQKMVMQSLMVCYMANQFKKITSQLEKMNEENIEEESEEEDEGNEEKSSNQTKGEEETINEAQEEEKFFESKGVFSFDPELL